LPSSLLPKNLKFKIQRTIILRENMVLRRIFVPKGDAITAEWRKLHNEELNKLYSTPNIFSVINWRRM